MTPKNVVKQDVNTNGCDDDADNDIEDMKHGSSNNKDSKKKQKVLLPDVNVLEGPDLNEFRTPYDKKLYRQILLPNGLRVVLISDTIAMKQSYNNYGGFSSCGGGSYDEDSDDNNNDDMEENEEGEDEDDDGNGKEEDSADGSEESDEDGDDEGGGGLRNAAAAMVVGVGSYSDPPECQGLAHFLEHLLFMGSTKYPKENAYDEFMSEHGGSDNAYTELEHTVYHFDIPQDKLRSALDMFAQFFVSPLMLENAVERELQSIESEFQLVKNSDNCRLQQLMSYTCGNKHHPFAKFSWGNLQSLKEIPKSNNVNPLEKLREFYNKHYYASNMRLVVIGGYPLDVLQDYVVSSFSDIRELSSSLSSTSSSVVSTPTQYTWNSTTSSDYDSPMKYVGLPIQNFGRVYYIAPVKDRHSLSITWQLPCQFDKWKSKPCEIVAHLIGHEANGSILASLKSKNWATALSAGVGSEGFENASSHALFTVSISLSEEGVASWPKVVSEVYKYIGMLRYYQCEQDGLPTWIYEELRSINEVAHKYGDEESPEDIVETFAEEMAPEYCLPPERLLDGSDLLFEYRPELIQEILDSYLSPTNARIDISSTICGRSADYETIEPATDEVVPCSSDNKLFDPKDAGRPRKEPIFGSYFWCEQISESRLQHWSNLTQPQLPPPDALLSLPPQNQFIPTDFDLKALPPTDCDHPLLNCSIKLQIAVGKRKQWFPATVTRYNSIQKQLLLSYEDEEEKWHKVDTSPEKLTTAILTSSEFEDTLDSKTIKYRVVALAEDGAGAVRMFGDESDYDVEDGNAFPPIPPARQASRLPKLICNTQVLRLWHLHDRTFKRPIAEIRLQLNCAEANKTPLHGACADILDRLVVDSLTEIAYLASVCEIGSALSSTDAGFTIRVHGFNDKLLKLFLLVVERIMDFRGRTTETSSSLPTTVNAGRFDLILETYRRACINAGMKASKLSSSARVKCLRPTIWSANQKLKAIEKLDVRTFMSTVGDLLHKIGAQCLYHGNVNSRDADLAQQEILSRLQASGGGGLPRKKYPLLSVIRIPEAANHTVRLPAKDPTDVNTAVEIYFQISRDNLADRVMVDLLVEMMYEPLYDQLRTKDQYGYDVSCDSRWTDGIIGMHFRVVTSSKTAQDTDDRIEQFLRDFRQTLNDMTDETFMKHLVGLATQKLEMHHAMSQETNDFWSEIRDGRYAWETSREETIFLKSVNKKQAIKAYEEWLLSSKRKRMSVHVICSEGEASEGRPEADQDQINDYIDSKVQKFHKFCKHQKYGRIY